jgi:hypothetical protein
MHTCGIGSCHCDLNFGRENIFKAAVLLTVSRNEKSQFRSALCQLLRLLRNQADRPQNARLCLLYASASG